MHLCKIFGMRKVLHIFVCWEREMLGSTLGAPPSKRRRVVVFVFSGEVGVLGRHGVDRRRTGERLREFRSTALRRARRRPPLERFCFREIPQRGYSPKTRRSSKRGGPSDPAEAVVEIPEG